MSGISLHQLAEGRVGGQQPFDIAFDKRADALLEFRLRRQGR